jgi:DNA-binding CsgD family transcriptional regulator
MPSAQRRAPAAATPGDAITLLTAFSRRLLALRDGDSGRSPGEWLGEALGGLRSLVPFASAWWGECSDASTLEPPLNWQHGCVDLAATFAEEWNAIGAADEFGRRSMAALGEVCLASGYESASAQVEAFSRRHSLYHAMAVTIELPESGLLFFVSIYRGEHETAFDALESALFGEFCRHLMQRWRALLKDYLLQATASSTSGFALCEATGRVLYIDAALARAVRRQYPAWQGTRLPAELAARLPQAPCTLHLGRRRLGVTACGPLVSLSLGATRDTATLAPRERAAALLYAGGESYRAIAARLGLSPATVRTYLRDAYLQLGVRNKVELGARLGLGSAGTRR